MSSLWTPGGEHRVPPADAGAEPGGHRGAGRADPHDGADAFDDADGLDDALDDALDGAELAAAEELQAELAAARQRVAELPAAQIVANHAMGLFELAAIHLSSEPPRPSEARLAIDALAALVDGVGDRLGEATPTLREALHHLRLRYVQVRPPPATS